jgi:sulfur-carrier protein
VGEREKNPRQVTTLTLRVLLFAKLRDEIGSDATSVELPTGASVAELRRQLAETYPALAPLLAKCAVAVDHDFAEDAHPLAAGNEVAIIPPVSGG